MAHRERVSAIIADSRKQIVANSAPPKTVFFSKVLINATEQVVSGTGEMAP